VGAFSTTAVSRLKKEAEFIGSMRGQVYLGVLSADEVDDILKHTRIGPILRQAYQEAAAGIGGGSALSVAVDSARRRAATAICTGRREGESYGNYTGVLAAAERLVREMLAGVPPAGRARTPAAGVASPAVNQVLTINGRPQHLPEGPQTLERRGRLFVECVRRLADDPLTAPAAYGKLIGYGSGLERLVDSIAPLFEREQSLVRWVALRGALAWLYREVLRPQGATRSPQEFAEAMGLAWVRGEAGDYVLAPQPREQLSGERRNVAVATANVALNYLTYYQRIMKMSVRELNADAMCAELEDDIALECIAWCAVACLRLGIDRERFANLPEPDALTHMGWYTDPISTEYQRYWDGSDWTAECRTRNGDRIVQSTIPLR
jgi:hypothetical protein